MRTNKLFLGSLFCVALICAAALFAQKPLPNIDSKLHPNLAEAQLHIQQAWEKVDVAQKDNKDELGDHAQKAKQHLQEAHEELKLAAEYANAHRRK
jgi:hypothetical protein